MPSFSQPFTLSASNALRIADLLESFGYNAFPNGQDGSGGYNTGTATSAAHLTAIRYLTANTGMGLTNRLYEDGANANAQVTFANAISSQIPAVKWSVCGGFGAGITNAETLADGLRSAGNLIYVEGINEPNNANVHQNGVAFTSAQCLTYQQGIYGRYHPLGTTVADASIIDTGPDFTTYPGDYLGTNTAAEIAACDYWNAHHYPNSGTPTNDMWLFGGGVNQSQGWPANGVVTEFHPTLFNSVTSEAVGAYYTITALLSGFLYFNRKALTWFTLYDYTGFSPLVGLFTGFDPTIPRIPAKYIHNLFALCSDAAATRHTFSLGGLNYSVTGLPAKFAGQNTAIQSGGGQSALFQGSNGTFYLFIWNDQTTMSATTVPVTVNLTNRATRVVDFSITNNTVADSPVAIQNITNVQIINMNLQTEVRVLVITP